MRGVKLNKLTNLAGDIALSLGAPSVRIAPITGRNSVVGVEVPNQLVTPVPIREVIDSREFHPRLQGGLCRGQGYLRQKCGGQYCQAAPYADCPVPPVPVSSVCTNSSDHFAAL